MFRNFTVFRAAVGYAVTMVTDAEEGEEITVVTSETQGFLSHLISYLLISSKSIKFMKLHRKNT